MAFNEDRSILFAALESALAAYQRQKPQTTLLSWPDKPIMDAIEQAISKCSAFEPVAGRVLYSGGSGPVISAGLFASDLFGKANDRNVAEAVDWLLRLLATRKATGLFKVAIWGASIDEELRLADGSHIMPFEALTDTSMKARILDRAKGCHDKSAWLAHNYFDKPKLALVQEVPDFPYISGDVSGFQLISDLQMKARDLWLFLEAASIGHPVAIGCWFEYADQDLDINGWDNHLAWLLPEIPPRVANYAPMSANAVRGQLQQYAKLPEDLRSRLLRSMERFTLSQCRRQFVDRILDLALAFEIAVSGPDRGFAPVGWRVGVRSAQLIGGALAARQSNRDRINALYRIRNKATHGSDLSKSDQRELEQAVQQCLPIYKDLLTSFLALGQMPDWNSLELEPRA
jgi:hypothetical protein